ncbi:MAG: hypothetical protein ACXVAY_08935 [Mucilaginibacter sp.]
MLKKVLAGVLILFSILFSGIYLIIPAHMASKHEVVIATAEMHAFKFLTNKNQWAKWWPGQSDTQAGVFSYKDSKYVLKSISNSAIEIIRQHNNLSINSKISFIATDKGRVKVDWIIQEPSGRNPFKIVRQYLEIKRNEDNLAKILNALKAFLEDDRNIYHIDVKLSTVKDSLVYATQVTMAQYPSMDKVYRMIDVLKKQIALQHGKQIDDPMLNIHQIGINNYAVMVGIPVDKMLKNQHGSFINKMVLGNILTAKVTGGINTIRTSVEALESYRKDYGLISPAMPFESLKTNRMAEKDTSKWVTNLFYPIF